MAVKAVDLLAVNGGEIEASFFPGEDAAARLTSYIQEAEAKVSDWMAANEGHTLTNTDNAVKAWVLSRAFRQAYTILISNPARMEVADQGGGHQFIREQMSNMLGEAQRWRGEYEAIIAANVPPNTPSEVSGTQSVDAVFKF